METFETKKHADNYDAEKEREHGPDGTLVEVTNESETKELLAALSEVEDFESEQDCELLADVIDDKLFDELLSYIKENCEMAEG